MAKQDIITAERARELFHYDPESGVLTRKIRTAQRVQVGDAVGSLRKDGRLAVCVDYKKYLVHDLIWLWVTGEWPSPEPDHQDMNGSNNRWSNLRLATKSQNGANRKMQPNNRVGLKGVGWHKTMKKYRARLMKHKREIFVEYFDCPAAAHLAYIVAADIHFGEFARSS